MEPKPTTREMIRQAIRELWPSLPIAEHPIMPLIDRIKATEADLADLKAKAKKARP